MNIVLKRLFEVNLFCYSSPPLSMTMVLTVLYLTVMD